MNEVIQKGVIRGGRWRVFCERKGVLVEHNMTRDDYTVGGEVETPVTPMIGGVTEEHTRGGSRGEFVESSGRKIGVATTSENSKMIERRRRAEKDGMRSFGVKRFCGMKVEKMGGGVESFYPINRWHTRLEEK